MKLKTMLIIQTIAACLSIVSFGISVWQAFWGTWWVSLVAFLLAGFFWSGLARGLQRKIKGKTISEELEERRKR